MNDLSKWIRLQILEGGWNSEVYNVILNSKSPDGTRELTVVMKDNKRLKVTVEVVQ
jgi:hypothetical protein